MSEPRVTVAVLTRNRPHYLKLALDSILSQRGVELEVLVLDNASTDETRAVVGACADPRLRYFRSETNIGLMRNWNRGIALATERSPFVSIFHDDDIMLDGFLSESARALSTHPSAGMSLCMAQYVGPDGTLRATQSQDDVEPGLNNGLSFLERAINARPLGIAPPVFLFRSEALRRAGPADSPHARGTIDMNLYIRIAAISDFVFIPKVLVQYRGHESSETQLINETGLGVAWYAAMAERVDAIAYLLRSKRAAKAAYRNWLAERLLAAHGNQSAAIHPCLPQMWHSWDDCRAIALDYLDGAVPRGEPFILIDDQHLGIGATFNGRKVIPFLERDGEYDGPPDDEDQGIQHLDRLRRDTRWLALAWPSFWWLDHYGRLHKHLETCAVRRVSSPHVRIYELHAVERSGSPVTISLLTRKRRNHPRPLHKHTLARRTIDAVANEKE